jgi:hypothetical protein
VFPRELFSRESLNRVTAVPQSASQNSMRFRPRESEKSFFRGSLERAPIYMFWNKEK